MTTTTCPFCNERKATFLVNEAEGYGHPEVWSCGHCLRAAEPGSALADTRERLYPELTGPLVHHWRNDGPPERKAKP